jgi:hypothetical protein
MTEIRDDFDRWLDAEAGKLRERWDSPELWPRIAGSLEEERWRAETGGRRVWPLAMAAMLALTMLFGGWLVWVARTGRPALLSEQALEEVQKAESAYAQSIEKLARLARPRLEDPPDALASSYREKLMLLDNAIEALKAEAARNPYHDHLRRELLALYQDKQRTLEGILNEKQSGGLAR